MMCNMVWPVIFLYLMTEIYIYILTSFIGNNPLFKTILLNKIGKEYFLNLLVISLHIKSFDVRWKFVKELAKIVCNVLTTFINRHF